MGENVLWLHPEAAAERGIAQGDRVRVTDRFGRHGELPVKVTTRIRRDTVFMVHGFGHFDERMTTAHSRGAADSNLASADQDQRLGTISMGRALVRVEKA
jgi:thiosulfate reductase/polysulfide reductase chain A